MSSCGREKEGRELMEVFTKPLLSGPREQLWSPGAVVLTTSRHVIPSASRRPEALGAPGRGSLVRKE